MMTNKIWIHFWFPFCASQLKHTLSLHSLTLTLTHRDPIWNTLIFQSQWGDVCSMFFFFLIVFGNSFLKAFKVIKRVHECWDTLFFICIQSSWICFWSAALWINVILPSFDAFRILQHFIKSKLLISIEQIIYFTH